MTDVWVGIQHHGTYEGDSVLLVAATQESAHRPRLAFTWRPCQFDDDVDDPAEHSTLGTTWAESTAHGWVEYRVERWTVQP